MKEPKDIVDLLKEKDQLELQLSDLRSKDNRTGTEDVIIEEMKHRLGVVLRLIDKY